MLWRGIFFLTFLVFIIVFLFYSELILQDKFEIGIEIYEEWEAWLEARLLDDECKNVQTHVPAFVTDDGGFAYFYIQGLYCYEDPIKDGLAAWVRFQIQTHHLPLSC